MNDNNDTKVRKRRPITFGPKWTKSANRSATLLPQIGKLIGLRYGGPCRDDDAVLYYDAALPYLVDLAGTNDRLHGFTSTTWLRWCAPSLAPVIADENQLGAIEPGALEHIRDCEGSAIQAWHRHQESRFFEGAFGLSGRELGEALQIRADEIRAARIRFVSPIDKTAAELKAERKASDAAYKQAKRDEEGARAQSSSIEALELWKELIIGRRKFYKLKAAGCLPDLPEIPRGADPAPFVAEFVASYKAMQGDQRLAA